MADDCEDQGNERRRAVYSDKRPFRRKLTERGDTHGKGVEDEPSDRGLRADRRHPHGGARGRPRSVDWLCLPRFDSPACFAALLGTDDNGFWSVAPAEQGFESTRRYRGPSLVLETEFRTSHGEARVVDCMPARRDYPRLVRVVEGIGGEVQGLASRTVGSRDSGS